MAEIVFFNPETALKNSKQLIMLIDETSRFCISEILKRLSADDQ